MTLFLTIVIFLVIISILVFFHELGHFLAAKASKIPVHAFAVGFGPSLYNKKIGETEYKIGVIPLGGYVQIEGEEDSQKEDGFRSKPFIIKFFVLSAGVIANILIAIVAFQIHLGFNNHQIAVPSIISYEFNNVEKVDTLYPIQVVEVIESGNSDGEIFNNELIVGINGERFASRSEFTSLIDENQNSTVDFEFLDIDTYQTSIRPISIESRNEPDSGILEVVTIDLNTEFGVPTYFVTYKQDLVSPIALSWDMTIFQVNAIGGLFSTAVESGDYSQVSEAVGGPIQVGNTVGQVIDTGLYSRLFFLAGAISLSLAIFNIIPFPALDGGQIAIAAIESITRRRLKDSTVNAINLVGFVLLIVLSIFIAIKDLVQVDALGATIDFFARAFGR